MFSLSAMSSWFGGAVALVLMSTATLLQAQGTKADYERFDKIGDITGGKVFRTKVQPHWLNSFRKALGYWDSTFKVIRLRVMAHSILLKLSKNALVFSI